MKRKADHVEAALCEIESQIREEFRTLERFSYETGVIPKATLAKIMANKKDCRVSSLQRIAEGLNGKLVLKIVIPKRAKATKNKV